MNRSDKIKRKGKIVDTVGYLISFAEKLGELKQSVTDLKNSYKFDRILSVIYTLLIIGMFCYLRWGTGI